MEGCFHSPSPLRGLPVMRPPSSLQGPAVRFVDCPQAQPLRVRARVQASEWRRRIGLHGAACEDPSFAPFRVCSRKVSRPTVPPAAPPWAKIQRPPWGLSSDQSPVRPNQPLHQTETLPLFPIGGGDSLRLEVQQTLPQGHRTNCRRIGLLQPSSGAWGSKGRLWPML